MKLLHVISSVNPAGGGPIEAAYQFSVRMAATGHHSEIASLDSPDAPYINESPVGVHALGPAHLGYHFSSRFIPWLRANRSQYDAVIVHGIWQFPSFGSWRALRNSNTPYVLYTHGMLDPWFKRRYPLKHLKKWMYWPWAEYRVLRDAQAVLFTCEEERLLARKSFWLYHAKESIVSYGIAGPPAQTEAQLAEFFTRYPALRGKRIALFMGRVHPKKGCDLLIEAFAKVLSNDSAWHLLIAGPDQMGWQDKLNRLAQRLGLASQITWTGMISGPLKWGALRAAEIFVLPSHQENLGIVVPEALSVGVPTLISDKVNIWREVQADGAGMVADDSLKGTCRMLQSYLDLPEDKKLNMRQAARPCFDRRFEIKKATERLHTVLAGVAGVN